MEYQRDCLDSGLDHRLGHMNRAKARARSPPRPAVVRFHLSLSKWSSARASLKKNLKASVVRASATAAQVAPLRVILENGLRKDAARATPGKRLRAETMIREHLLSTGLPYTVEAFFHTVRHLLSGIFC